MHVHVCWSCLSFSLNTCLIKKWCLREKSDADHYWGPAQRTQRTMSSRWTTTKSMFLLLLEMIIIRCLKVINESIRTWHGIFIRARKYADLIDLYQDFIFRITERSILTPGVHAHKYISVAVSLMPVWPANHDTANRKRKLTDFQLPGNWISHLSSIEH